VPHTYADLDQFKAFLKDGGEQVTGGLGVTNDNFMLSILEAASRTVDAYCDRSRFGSGFGPRTGTNVYDASGEQHLDLKDDLLTYTSGTVKAETGGTGATVAETTDMYLDNGTGIYASPYRRLRLHGLTSKTVGSGLRIWSVVGKWGYADERFTATPTTNEALDTSETGVDVTATTGLSIGQTWLVDSEQMYVTGVSSTTFTVVRGANGTTAATHATSAPIDVYRYPREARMGTQFIAQRRWRARQAGAGGSYASADVPEGQVPLSEMAILSTTVGHLRVRGGG